MPITAADIQEFRIVEDGSHDFKEQVDLDSDQGKAKLVDDVVAFLNVGHGNLIIGVKEERGKGRFQSWFPVPIPDDKFDDYALRITSILKSNIDPMPMGIKVHPIEREGGIAVHIEIGEHRMQPYQNKLTGGFRLRTDRNNQIIPRDQIQAHFKRFADYKADLARLMETESTALKQRGIMTEDGPVLTIGILPREHYGDHPRFEANDGLVVKPGPVFPYSPGGDSESFKGRSGGAEVRDLRFDGKANSRFFISDEWFMHATVVHPFSRSDDGRVTIYEMREKLERYLKRIGALLTKAGVAGPFVVAYEFSDLQRNKKVGRAFEDNGPVTYAPRSLLETFDAPAMAEEAYETIRRASIPYG